VVARCIGRILFLVRWRRKGRRMCLGIGDAVGALAYRVREADLVVIDLAVNACDCQSRGRKR